MSVGRPAAWEELREEHVTKRIRVCRSLDHGHRPFCFETATYILRVGRPRRIPGHDRCRVDADGHLSRDQHPGRHHRLAIYRAEHHGDGATGHDLRPICAVVERERHSGYRGADPQRHLGSENLLPAGRQSRSRDRADRVGDQFYPHFAAAGDPGAGRGPVQRLERSRPADRSLLRHAQRAAALRLRHLPPAPAAGADPRRHASHPGRRQVPPDHGRYRSAQAAGQGIDAPRRGQCRQCPEPDTAVRPSQDR